MTVRAMLSGTFYFYPSYRILNQVSPRLRGCVIIQEFAYFLSVMPDLIRHPAPELSEKTWIPGQARNDKNRMMRGFDNCDTAS